MFNLDNNYHGFVLAAYAASPAANFVRAVNIQGISAYLFIVLDIKSWYNKINPESLQRALYSS